MTKAKKQIMLQHMTGETDVDVLSTYLTLAENIVLNKAFPYGDGSEEMPEKYETVQVEIASEGQRAKSATSKTVCPDTTRMATFPLPCFAGLPLWFPCFMRQVRMMNNEAAE